MPDRKSKIISLRLSQEEYESLKSLYSTRGVRSLSEFARDAMRQVLGDAPHSGPDLLTRVALLDGKVAVLEDEVSRLSRAVEHHFPPRRLP